MVNPKQEPGFTLFESAKQPPPVGSRLFIPNLDPAEFGWERRVAEALPPQVCTPIEPNDHARGVFLTGAQAMGLVGRTKEIQPQQLLQGDLLNMGRKFTAIMQPRRATKTSGILAWLIGRCLAEPDLSAAFTIATTGKATRQKFIKEVVPPLERVWPYEDDRPMKILRGAGAEMLKFTNGSFLSFVPFKGESFRSDAFDIIVIDEAQDPEPEDADDVLAAIMPTLDTRPGAQVVVAGTAGYWREGNMLWDQLAAAETGDERRAILAYRAPVEDDVDVTALVADWPEVERLVRLSHPGVHSGLTTMEAVKDNWHTLKPHKFAAEYLGIFGRAASTTFINYEDYNANRQEGDLPAPPAHFRYALAVHPDELAWSIVAAWRDTDYRPHLAVLATGPGTLGAYEECRRLFLRYRLPVAYDSMLAANATVTGRFEKTRPKTRSNPMAWAQVSTSHATLWSEIKRRTLVHWGHEGMDQAARDIVKRGTRDAKRWAFGRPPERDDADITTFEAGAIALRAYDDAPVPQTERLGIVS